MFEGIMESLEEAFISMFYATMTFLPTVIVALAIILVGWLLGGVLKRVVVKVFRTMKVNDLLSSAGVDALVERAGYPLKAGIFVGTLVKWFVIAVFFVVALDILGLTAVTDFLREVVLGYLPHVIVAVLILLVASIVAHFASTAVVVAFRTAQVSKPEMFGKVVYYAIVVFAVLAALNQLKIAQELVQMLFAGLVFASALALGLAFGLGGRETAARYLDKVTRGPGSN